MRWTEGLDCALSVMLAAVASTPFIGSQLWIKVLSPPSTGKTSLCEAVAVAERYVVAKSTVRGFHSGMKGGGGEKSLIDLIRHKTLVTKDGDSLLQSPNLAQILSEGRDLFDGSSRSHYRNGEGLDYTGHRCTWILAGTKSLRAIDSSELGERFLDCVIMEDIDEDLEDEIAWRVANRASRHVGIESNGQAASQYDPDLAEAMSLTAGYIEHLREVDRSVYDAVSIPEPALRKITRLAKFVAFMRARPHPKTAEEDDGREFAPRLVEQHVRLAKCLAVVLNHEKVDREILLRVKKVALDTGRGKTLKLAAKLYANEGGFEIKSLALHLNEPEDKARAYLRFLRRIGVVEIVESKANAMLRTTQRRYVLTARMRRLYAEVVD